MWNQDKMHVFLHVSSAVVSYAFQEITHFACSHTCIQSHDTGLKTMLHCFPACSPEPRGFWKWSALPRKLSPRCCFKAHSSWCWRCAEGKPGLKGKCWEPQEPQPTSDCSAIIFPSLSCTWKEKSKKKNFICSIQCNQYTQTMWMGREPTLLFSHLDRVYLVLKWGTGAHMNKWLALAEVDCRREVIGNFHTV